MNIWGDASRLQGGSIYGMSRPSKGAGVEGRVAEMSWEETGIDHRSLIGEYVETGFYFGAEECHDVTYILMSALTLLCRNQAPGSWGQSQETHWGLLQ